MNRLTDAVSPIAAYYDEYWTRDQLAVANDRHAVLRLRLLRALLPTKRPLKVLDAGAGLGHVVGALHAAGVDATGMDISGEAVEMAARLQPLSRFTRHSVEELPWPFEPSSVDVVVSFEVIEHLLRPRQLLLGAHHVLKPGGHLALTTPYHGRLKNLALAMLSFDRHFAVEGDHIRFFTDATLRRLLAETGFESVRMTHFGRIPRLSAGVFVWARKA